MVFWGEHNKEDFFLFFIIFIMAVTFLLTYLLFLPCILTHSIIFITDYEPKRTVWFGLCVVTDCLTNWTNEEVMWNSQFYHHHVIQLIHEQLYLGIKRVEKLYRVSFCCESVGHSFIDRYGHKYTLIFCLIFFVKDKKKFNKVNKNNL